MARQSKAAANVEDAAQSDAPDATGSVEEVFEGMEDMGGGAEGDTDEDGKRPRVPREMRPIFGEVARLSSTLSLARKACYDNDPERALKALSVLERQVPGAIEVAELVAP